MGRRKRPLGEDKIYVAFGKLIASLRENANLTQEQLAKKVGFSKYSIASIETGRQRVYLASVFIFAGALKVAPGALVNALVPTPAKGGKSEAEG